jgi:hypothetical protein
MSLRSLLTKLAALTAPALMFLVTGSAFGGDCADGKCDATCATGCDTGCGTKCNRFHCPPPYVHRAEGPPHIKFKQGCPKPVCPPCELPHWGYYQTCWRTWPFPPDWSHCEVPPPGVLANCPEGTRFVPAAPAAAPANVIPPTLEKPLPSDDSGKIKGEVKLEGSMPVIVYTKK